MSLGSPVRLAGAGRPHERAPRRPRPGGGRGEGPPDQPPRGSRDGRSHHVLGARGRGRHEESLRGVHGDRQGREHRPRAGAPVGGHPDNKGFRFYLRKGVEFHSGREFTAKDVKWTFEQILLPATRAGSTLTYLKVLEGAQDILDGKATQLSGVKVVDPYTVEIRFAKPDVLFPIYPFQFMDSGIVAQNGTTGDQGLCRNGAIQVRAVEAWPGGAAGRPQGLLGSGAVRRRIVHAHRAELRHRHVDVRGQRARLGRPRGDPGPAGAEGPQVQGPDPGRAPRLRSATSA